MISARKAKQLDATTMFTYSHANTPLGQSERAYYLGYFIKISVTFGFRLETAIPLLLREITLLSQHNEISIAFPDDGAFKRFHAMFSSFPTITCTKLREGDKRIVRVKDGNITLHSLYLILFSRNISVLALLCISPLQVCLLCVILRVCPVVETTPKSLACSRLRDSERSFRKRKCEIRSGAGERRHHPLSQVARFLFSLCSF